MSLSPKKSKIFSIILLIFSADQLTKYLASEYLAPYEILKILPFLNLVYVENTGTAFGMFKFLNSGFFIVIALIAIFILISFLFKDPKNWLVYSLLIAGALGNITDRLIYGFVIDFIDLHIAGFHWPAFNIADTAITLGIILFLYKSFRK